MSLRTRRYAYVLAYFNVDGYLSFHSTKVVARGQTEAYDKGHKWAVRRKLLPLTGGNKYGNDYVIAI
jgi:hypothetical protein